MEFALKRHIEEPGKYQCFFLTEFSFETTDEVNEDHVLEDFLKSDALKYDTLSNIQKHNPEKAGFLRKAFDFDLTGVSDFQKIDKEQTEKFLIDLRNEPDWGEDLKDFKKLLKKYFRIHKKLSGNFFYVINRDWFYDITNGACDECDERLHNPECWVYTLYFMIIHVDMLQKEIMFVEWFSD